MDDSDTPHFLHKANSEPPDLDLDLVKEFLLVSESADDLDTSWRLAQRFSTDPPEALPPGPEYEAES